MNIRFDRLDDVVKATETLPLGNFSMASVFTVRECGTVGCMIGNYNALAGREKTRFGTCDECDEMDDWDYFGISADEYYWLFTEGPLFNKPLATNWEGNGRPLARVPRDEALSRLRKFIAYKRAKHELIYDEKYGVTELSRRLEGNHGFVKAALEVTAV